MTHMYIHLCPLLLLRVHEHTLIWCAPFTALPGVLPLHTHTNTSRCLLEIWLMMTHTYAPIPMPTLDCLHKHIFLHVYRSVFLARMWRYTQLVYLFHQCASSLLSRDGRIANCTVRHPGVERPLSSSIPSWI